MKFKKIIYSIILSVSSFVYAEEISRFTTESETSVVSASQVAISQEIDDEISRIWKDSSFLFNDTVLLPSADNNGVNVHTNLRRQPETANGETRGHKCLPYHTAARAGELGWQSIRVLFSRRVGTCCPRVPCPKAA